MLENLKKEKLRTWLEEKWLASVGFGHYNRQFSNLKIDGPLLHVMEANDLLDGLGILSRSEQSSFFSARDLLEFCNYIPKIFEKLLETASRHKSAKFPNSLSSPYFFVWSSKRVCKWLQEEVRLSYENVDSAFRGLHGAFLLSEEFQPDELLKSLASGLPEQERPKPSEEVQMKLRLCTKLLELYEDFLSVLKDQEQINKYEMQSQDELFQDVDEPDEPIYANIEEFQDNVRGKADKNKALVLGAHNLDKLDDKSVKAAFFNPIALEEIEMSQFDAKDVSIEKQLHHLCRRFHSKCLAKQEEIKVLFEKLTKEEKTKRQRRESEDLSALIQSDARASLAVHDITGSPTQCPTYWTRCRGNPLEHGDKVETVEVFGEERTSIERMMKESWDIRMDKDVCPKRDCRSRIHEYNSFEIKQIIRIENPGLFHQYVSRRQKIEASGRLQKSDPPIITSTVSAYLNDQVNHRVNEYYLWHGTRDSVRVAIQSNGFDSRIAYKGFFGTGSYFAEHCTKSNFYVGKSSIQNIEVTSSTFL